MNINLIRLSIQRALLDHITPNLRAVNIKDSNDIIELIFYYDHPPTEDEQELFSLTDTEFIADYPSPDYHTNSKIITLPRPAQFPEDEICVYRRYE